MEYVRELMRKQMRDQKSAEGRSDILQPAQISAIVQEAISDIVDVAAGEEQEFNELEFAGGDSDFE